MAITKEQAIDILDKFDFFQGQRAGRELWSNKPYEVQEEDINAFARDCALLKEYISDVVPKSEVELPPELPTEVRNEVNERARKAVQKLYEKAYQDAIEYPENYGDIFEGYENNLPTALALINWQKMEIEGLTINMNAYGLAAKRLAEQKTEVAREIFEEIERTLDNYHSACLPAGEIEAYTYYEGGLEEAIAELKKKYTEGSESDRKTMQQCINPKPPLGIMPRNIYQAARIEEILSTMIRYYDSKKEIPREWIEELIDYYRRENVGL